MAMPAEVKKDVNFVSVPLNRPFDQIYFDNQVKNTLPPVLDEMYILKYIVCKDTMYVFPGTVEHKRAWTMLRERGTGTLLQSAGHIKLFYDNPLTRVLDGHSESLLGLLPEGKSNIYKEDVMRERLSSWFEVK